MDDISYIRYVFWIFPIIISTVVTENNSINDRPVVYMNGRKVNFTLFHHNDCPPKHSNLETPIENITFHHFTSTIAGKPQNFINCTYQHAYTRNQILGHVIHQEANKTYHLCNSIVFPHKNHKIHKNNVFNINFLPTDLTNINSVSIMPFRKLKRFKRRRPPPLEFLYNKSKEKLRVDIPMDYSPSAYTITVFKNASETCTSGVVEKRFRFSRDPDDPMPHHIYIALKPQEGEFCIYIDNNHKSRKFNLTGQDEIPTPNCVYDGAINDWNITIDTKTNSEKFSAEVTLVLISAQHYTCLKKFKVDLCEIGTTCTRPSTCNHTTYAYQPHLKLNYAPLEYGNYCVYVLPLCDGCGGERLMRHSKIVTLAPLSSVLPVESTISTKPTSHMELSIILSVIASAIVVVSVVLSLLFHYYLKKRLEGYNLGNYYTHSDVGDIIRKVKEKAKVELQRVMLVSVAVDPTLKTAVDKLTQVLRTNYYCEVVLADPSTVRDDCGRLNLTLPNDAIDRMINNSNKVIFIKPITDLDNTLVANNFAEAIFLSCRENIIAGWPRKWSSENVAIVELVVDNENTFKVLENHYLHMFSLPAYFAHLFGFIHNVNGDVINEKKFEQFWKMADDTTLQDFKLFLENCRKRKEIRVNVST